MTKNEIRLDLNEILVFLKDINFTSDKIELFQSNNRISDYLIDERFILRFSKSTLNELAKLEKVQTISCVPKIYVSGEAIFIEIRLHFMITDFVFGTELFSEIPTLTSDQQKVIGREIA